MATPENDRAKYAGLYDWAGIQIFNLVRERFHPDLTQILDVGAGWGKYKLLLPDYAQMDACEIWVPYIHQNNLESLYREVFPIDICNLGFNFYDVIIMGDVFEHIERQQAKDLLKTMRDKSTEVYIIVPYEYEQGEEDGNPYEEHKQADLTPELMKIEYPELDLLTDNGNKGIYIWQK